MPKFSSFQLAYKALRELGPKQLGLYAWYWAGLRSGYLRWKTRGEDIAASRRWTASGQPNLSWLNIPSGEAIRAVIGTQGLSQLLAEADEIVEGRVRLFGGPPVALQLEPPEPIQHWTAYEKDHKISNNKDIKWIWEPGRFGWAQTLARAYHLSEEEKYAQAFWAYTEAFLAANPPNMGPHWASAQEVALRLMALAFACQLLLDAAKSTSQRLERLADAIASHAGRILPTLSYARAQNNNHLLTEAAGLLTASSMLPEHPEAYKWKKSGSRWFNHGLQNQIALGGSYVQHSTNYHRLMLQVALWVSLTLDRELPSETRSRLAAATRWPLELVEPENGKAPNLGPNDGAYIMPWTICPQDDYRPVVQAASLAFLEKPAYRPGAWDEMSLWFGLDADRIDANSDQELDRGAVLKDSPIVLRGDDSWAYLRVAQFNERPGHADQLHLDLWWRGLNIAQDAGTYLYNAKPPWDNALARTSVHNTITIENQDQMRRAGRFLWLDWAQGEVVERRQEAELSSKSVVAQHDGYRRLGAVHERKVEVQDNRWTIRDSIQPTGSWRAPLVNRKAALLTRLHWLLPDWPWDIRVGSKEPGAEMRVNSPHGWIKLRVSLSSGARSSPKRFQPKIQIYRAGEPVYGQGNASPIRGWTSRNYGYKSPALSFSVEVETRLPVTILSEWLLPD
ncbi:MAG TPA: alginate lyase family protein [Anaerolineales bacterium]